MGKVLTVAILLISILYFDICEINAESVSTRGENRVKSETTKEDLAETPAPPYRWDPFTPWPGETPNQYPPINEDDFFSTTIIPSDCTTSVKDPPGITIRLTGNIVGNLSYNDLQRGNGRPGASPAVNNGNKQLGGFRKQPGGAPSRTGYKYQVEITWEGPLKDAFWGQMASDMHYNVWNPNPAVEFDDDTPANDWVTKPWNLKPGEKKSDFPVVELVGQTLRYIDAPQGPVPDTVPGVKFFLIYAGACGKATHRKILMLFFPPFLLNPMAFEIPENDFLQNTSSVEFD